MPFNGVGVFTPVYNWEQDKANGIKIRADRMDGQDSDIATGLSTAICRDGQTTVLANLPMSNFKHTGVASAASKDDYLRADQAQKNDLTFFTTTGGTADGFVLTPSPPITALTNGLSFYIRMHAANATTVPTLAISGQAAATIQNGDLSALGIGDLALDGVYRVTYQGTAGYVLPNRTQPPVVNPWGLTSYGYQTTDFNATIQGLYYVYPATAGLNVILPNSSAAQGKFLMLVKLGQYPMNLCGTVNGIAGTVAITLEQSLPVSCTTARGWV